MAKRSIFDVPYASIHPHYVTKVTKKGRSVDDLYAVLHWLTGYDRDALQVAIDDDRSLAEFFALAPQINPDADLISGVVCGVRVEEITDPLMRKIRWMDKLVDELARGKKLESILRSA